MFTVATLLLCSLGMSTVITEIAFRVYNTNIGRLGFRPPAEENGGICLDVIGLTYIVGKDVCDLDTFAVYIQGTI